MAAVLTFARAVTFGTMVGGGMFLLLTVPLAILYFEWSRPIDSVRFAIVPLLSAGAMVVPAATLLGLPLTALFAYLKCETHSNYVIAGLGLGAIIPIALGVYLGTGPVGAIFALPGAAAGAVTAATWGAWRESLAKDRASKSDV